MKCMRHANDAVCHMITHSARYLEYTLCSKKNVTIFDDKLK